MAEPKFLIYLDAGRTLIVFHFKCYYLLNNLVRMISVKIKILAALLLCCMTNPAGATAIKFRDFTLGADTYNEVKKTVSTDTDKYPMVIYPKPFIIGTRTQIDGEEAFANFFFYNNKLAVVEIDFVNPKPGVDEKVKSYLASVYSKEHPQIFYLYPHLRDGLELACYTWMDNTPVNLAGDSEIPKKACRESPISMGGHYEAFLSHVLFNLLTREGGTQNSKADISFRAPVIGVQFRNYHWDQYLLQQEKLKRKKGDSLKGEL